MDVIGINVSISTLLTGLTCGIENTYALQDYVGVYSISVTLLDIYYKYKGYCGFYITSNNVVDADLKLTNTSSCTT